MGKGISPLVAAVLLIAVTMAIAGMLAYWASSFVKTQTGGFENQSVATQCNFGNLVIDACSYLNSSKIVVVLKNVGGIDLKEIALYVQYSNNSVSSQTFNDTLKINEIKSYTFLNVSSDYVKITARTHCPVVSAESGCR